MGRCFLFCFVLGPPGHKVPRLRNCARSIGLGAHTTRSGQTTVRPPTRYSLRADDSPPTCQVLAQGRQQSAHPPGTRSGRTTVRPPARHSLTADNSPPTCQVLAQGGQQSAHPPGTRSRRTTVRTPVKHSLRADNSPHTRQALAHGGQQSAHPPGTHSGRTTVRTPAGPLSEHRRWVCSGGPMLTRSSNSPLPGPRVAQGVARPQQQCP